MSNIYSFLNSAFIHLLLQSCPKSNGIITATEMYLYLRDRVEVLTEKQNKRQTPGLWLLKKHDKGEYIFLTQDFNRDNLKKAPSLDTQEENNPYRGLRPYEKEHADLFFGRTSLIEKLCDFVNVKVNEKNRQLTIVLGASGSGKSSLIKAGLIPHLADPHKLSQKRDLKQKIQAHQHKQQAWHILPVIRPSESPLNSLNTVVKDIVPEGSEVGFSKAIVSWGKQRPDSRILLTIDQFEELITQCKDESERKEFLTLLANALRDCPNFSLVLTLRSDFEPQFRDTALEADWKEARFIVPAMTREELREVIEEPASAKVVFFKPSDLIEQLIDEVAQMPGALPLLSFALSELYLQLARRYLDTQNSGEIVERAITQDDYDKLGGVTRSLTQRADQEYKALTKEDPAYEQTIRHVMLRMVAVGGELARRRVYFSELEYPEPENGRVKEVIKRFDAARLLTSDKDDEGRPYVEPAHDVLVRGWQKLSDWKQQDLASLILQRELYPRAERWKQEQSNKQSMGLLWNEDPRLPQLLQLLEAENSWLNQIEKEFIKRSSQRKTNNLRTLVGSVVVVILALSGLTIFAFVQQGIARINAQEATMQRDEAEKQQDLATKNAQEATKQRDEAKKQRDEAEKQQGIAIKNAQEATKQRDEAKKQQGIATINAQEATKQSKISEVRRINAEARADSFYWKGLMDAELFDLEEQVAMVAKAKEWTKSLEDLQGDTRLELVSTVFRATDIPRQKNIFQGYKESVYSVAFSPDGKSFLTGGADNTAKLWSLDGKLLQTFPHKRLVNSVAFSPNGEMIMTGSSDHTAKLWNTKGRLLASFSHADQVYSVAFSPDSKSFLTGSADRTANLWNIDGRVLHTFVHENSVNTVAFSPDGKKLLTGELKIAKLWNIDGILLQTFIDKDYVRSVAFSPDGNTIITGSADYKAKLWNINGRLLQTLNHQHEVYHVAFSSNGETILTGSRAGTAKLWNIYGRLLQTFKGHQAHVKSVAFSPDSKTILTGSIDETVKLWNISRRSLQTFPYQISTVVFSPDGKTFLTGEKKAAKLWSVGGSLLKIFPHDYAVTSVAFSRDSKTFLTGGDKFAKLWSVDGSLLKTFPHDYSVDSITFLPDGKTFLTGEVKAAKLWSIDGSLLKIFAHDYAVNSVAFSPDGKTFLTGEDKFAKLWSIDGNLLKTFAHDYDVISVAFSPDGETVLTGSHKNKDGTAKLWKLDGSLLQTFKMFQDIVTSVAFSPDGETILTGSTGGTAKLWKLDGRILQTFLHQDSVNIGSSVKNVAFSPDGKRFITVSENNLKLWDLDLEYSLSAMCDHLHDFASLSNDLNIPEESRNLRQRAKKACEGIPAPLSTLSLTRR